MITTTNNDDKVNDYTTWKVFRTGKSRTPLRKAKHYEQGQKNGSDREQPKNKNGSEQDDGGFKAQVNSGTVEVRFEIDQAKRNSFNLCIRLL
jgi:hypothetical protein